MRDLNSRVLGTVVFETTAIPGYANSAGMRHHEGLHNPDGCMKVNVKVAHSMHELEYSSPCTVLDVLRDLSLPESMSMVVYEGEVIPSTTILKSDTELEVIIVASGG